MLNIFGRRLRYGISVAALMAGTQAALLLNAYGGEGMAMVFSGAEPSIKIADSTTPSNDWDSAWGDGYSVQDFFKTRSFTSYTGPVTSGKRLMQADGYIKPCRHNLFTMSNKFASSAWTKTNGNVTGNVATSPDGAVNASKLYEQNATTSHVISQLITIPSGVIYTFSVYAKAGERSWLKIGTTNFGTGYSYFDLTNGVVGTALSGHTISMTSVGSGWYRCSVTATSTSTSATIFIGVANADSASSYAGDGASGIYVYGSHANAGAILDYVSSEAHNICLQSQTFQTTWSPTNTGVTADATTAPDGTTTADKLTETAVTDTFRVSMTITSISGTNYTCTVRAKAAERSWVLLRTNFGSVIDSYFNCSTGAQGTIGSGHTAHTPVALANGWYEFSVTVASTTTGSSFFNVGPANADAAGSYAGTLSSGIYVWGGQVEFSSTPGKYVATTAAAVYNQHFDIPVEYNTDGTVKALVREEARTNLLLRSTAFDNASWTELTIATIAAASQTSPSGATDANTLVSGSVSASHLVYQAVTVTTDATYALSFYVKKGTHRYVNIDHQRSSNNYANAVFDLDSGSTTATQTSVGATSGTITSTSMESVGNGWYRCTLVASATGTTLTASIGFATAATGNTVTIQGQVTFVGTGAETFHVYGGQCELGSTASSLVVTGSAAVTRASDVIQFPTTIVPYSTTQNTYYAKGSTLAVTSGVSMFLECAAPARADSLTQITGLTTTSTACYDRGAAFAVQAVYSATTALGVSSKFALACKTNDYNGAIDGVIGAQDTSGTHQATAHIAIGIACIPNLAAQLGSNALEEVMIVPSRLVDASLTTLTTP